MLQYLPFLLVKPGKIDKIHKIPQVKKPMHCKFLIYRNEISMWNAVYLFVIHVVQNWEAMEVITNNIGGEKLVYAGHMHAIKSVSGLSKRLECSHRKGLTCNGKIF